MEVTINHLFSWGNECRLPRRHVHFDIEIHLYYWAAARKRWHLPCEKKVWRFRSQWLEIGRSQECDKDLCLALALQSPTNRAICSDSNLATLVNAVHMFAGSQCRFLASVKVMAPISPAWLQLQHISLSVNLVNVKKNITSNILTHTWSSKWSIFTKLFAWMGCKSRDESNEPT